MERKRKNDGDYSCCYWINRFNSTVINISQHKQKIKSNEAREKEIDNKLSAMEKRLTDKIEDTKLNSNKRFLVDFMRRCEKGEQFSDEEIKYAFEAKKNITD